MGSYSSTFNLGNYYCNLELCNVLDVLSDLDVLQTFILVVSSFSYSSPSFLYNFKP